MSLVYLLVFCLAGCLIGWLRPRKYTTGILLILSVTSIFWLQPLTPIRNLDFWLPTASIALTIFVWALTYPGENRTYQLAVPGLAVILLTVFGIAVLRYFGPICCLTPSTPPKISAVIFAAGIIIILWLIPFYFFSHRSAAAGIAVVGIVGLFVIQKNETLSEWVGAGLRSLTGQSTEMAAPGDLAWMGFSFIAFRLLHVARDRQANRLPAFTLSEFAAYVLFFPAILSGPIDRNQRFIQELHNSQREQDSSIWKDHALSNTLKGFQRILIGVVKKIVIADSLAIFALNPQNAVQTHASEWLWVLLLAYTLRIYLDFSGYTDIALGVAALMGIKLPENFNRPYLKTNLTEFWNSWHMTLAQWFRSYVFFPVTRRLRTQKKPPAAWSVILIGQLLTMSLIGIWHGITWNFLIWGAWHGIGLFIQNRWSNRVRNHMENLIQKPAPRLVLQAAGWLVTIFYVSLGWIWFALPSPKLSLSVFARLVGGG